MPVSIRGAAERTLAVYLHWPYCQRICPYCDFNVYRHRGVDAAAWADACRRQLAHVRDLVPDRVVTSLYFGGGTPSLLAPDTVRRLIDDAARLWPMAADAEVTLEANPGDQASFADFRVAGVNRLSLGLQALDEEDLSALGRWHSVDEGRAAFAGARSVFDNVSIDLIYGRSGQTVRAWHMELEAALALGADHVSLYQLTIEAGTAFERKAKRGQLRLPDEATAARLFDLNAALCTAHGLPPYEISNYARPGFESRHNLAYWAYEDYAGVGPGAHGRVSVDGTKYATLCHAHPRTWRAAVDESDRGFAEWEALTREEEASELLLMGLRLVEGMPVGRYDMVAGRPLDRTRLETLVAHGLVAVAGDRLKATQKGRPVLDAVIARLLD